MDGCIIEGDAMLAAGAMLTPGKSVLHRQLWGGRPARYMRDLDDDADTRMRKGVEHYVHNAKAHTGAIKALYPRQHSLRFTTISNAIGCMCPRQHLDRKNGVQGQAVDVAVSPTGRR